MSDETKAAPVAVTDEEIAEWRTTITMYAPKWLRSDDERRNAILFSERVLARIDADAKVITECRGQPYSSNPREQSHAFQIEHMAKAITELQAADEAHRKYLRLTVEGMECEPDCDSLGHSDICPVANQTEA